jgi:hypothetical protein
MLTFERGCKELSFDHHLPITNAPLVSHGAIRSFPVIGKRYDTLGVCRDKSGPDESLVFFICHRAIYSLQMRLGCRNRDSHAAIVLLKSEFHLLISVSNDMPCNRINGGVADIGG